MQALNLRCLFVFALTGATLLTAVPASPHTADENLRARDESVAAAAQRLAPGLVETRRDFHMHPELSNREERTARVVAERLRRLGLEEIRTGVAKHGVVALLRGTRPGRVVAVRADMDALPIQDVNQTPYRSRVPGVKHACGHDAHTAIALGVAEVLSGMRDRFAGTIKFIFQPAEEGAPEGEEGGADLMVREGALENPRPEAIFGLHVTAMVETGRVAYRSGAAMASSDRFAATIKGKKVHGAYPHGGVDAVVVAAEAVLALQSIRSRMIDTQEPMVLTVGIIEGGNRFNIIADEVRLVGTVRTLNEDVRGRVQSLMKQLLSGVTAAHGATYELEYVQGAPVTFNDPALVERMLPTLVRVMGENNLVIREATMGAEDFSYFQRVIPGFYFFLGAGNSRKGITALSHTPEFDIDEDALPIGVRAMTGLLLDYLAEQRAR